MRSFLSCLMLLLPTVMLSSASAEEVFRWRGEVDGVDEIQIRGSSVRVNHLEAQPIQNQDYRFSAPLPRSDVRVKLVKKKGRGKVRLIEQPSSRNNYTATVEVDDSKGGSDRYEFELRWDEDDWDDDDDWSSGSSGRSGSDSWSSSSRNNKETFRWRGKVDIGAEIEIRGNHARVIDEGGSGTQQRSSHFTSSLPNSRTVVSLRKIKGRGKVLLIQSPSSSNDYTAVVRITDDKGGAGDYEFELSWRE